MLTFLLALTLLAAACGDDSTGPDAGSSGGDAQPTVAAGLTPQISWSGANARSITVTKMEGGQPTTSVWMVQSATGFPSPVTYGQLPAGASQLTAATPLQAGASYRVTLALVDNKGGFRDITR